MLACIGNIPDNEQGPTLSRTASRRPISHRRRCYLLCAAILAMQEESMSEAEALMCSSCGAPLEFNEGENQVKCEFCGNVMVVPERFRQRQAQPVIQLATPVIQIDASQYVDPLYTYSRRRLRGLGCYLTVLILFVVGLTTLPILITSA